MARTVLVVDDVKINRQILRKILEADYAVLEAENGQEAVATLNREYQRISAVLLDLVMPVMDGFEVLQRMRDNPSLSQIPVIVTTGNADEKTEAKALALGATDFVTKPFIAKIIKQRLGNLIKLRETSAMVNAFQKDRLTGLLNRDTFFERAADKINRQPEGYFVLGCVDIDNFKLINDRYGTEKGDEVLKRLARILREKCDAGSGLCGRITGDHFAALYPYSALEEGDAAPLLTEADLASSMDVPVKLSVGRYIVEDRTLGISAMYDRAKLAQDTVKGRFDVHVATYDESMRTKLVREQEIINEMNVALTTGQFEAWFQPQYNHATGALIGAEALARWRHPERGMISPSEFIPVFERNGFIYELDKCIWEQVCACLRRWTDEGRNPLPVSVNISRYDLFRADLVETIGALTEKYDIPEELLRLEVTESAFAESSEQVVKVVRQLIGHGFTVEIDDFGSGYSSLNTLKDVPAQILKLDMRFMDSSEDTDRGGNILESIVRMAKWINMSVIAEGVEKIAQADYLRSIGCNYIQGYLYARPMPVNEYEALAGSAVKEERLIALETVENLDNNAFWNPESLDTLIFNSYVGAAGIFEYQNGRIELERSTEKFAQTVGGGALSVSDTLRLDWSAYLDEENSRLVGETIRRSMRTKDEETVEVVFNDLPGCPAKTYIRAAFRVIATAGSRCLVYNVIENTTAQRMAERDKEEAERKERAAAAQLSGIMENIDGGITAATVGEDGAVSLLFANERYYSILGFTRAQFEAEVGDVTGLVHPDDRAATVRRAADVLARCHDDTYEYRCTRRDGEVIWIRCNANCTHFEGVREKVLLSVMTDITQQKIDEEKLFTADELLRFLNDVSHDLLAQPDIDVGIGGVLGKIREYFGADRAYILESDEAKRVSRNTYEVCAPGVPGEMDNLRRVPNESYGHWRAAFEKGEVIRIDDVSALPESRADERALLAAQGIRALLSVPFERDGKLVGFIGLDNPTHRQDQVGQLRALGDYLAVMLTRRDLTAKIEHESASVRMMMDDMPGGFMRLRVRPQGGLRMDYVNDGLCRMLGMTRENLMAVKDEDVMGNVHPDDTERVRSVMRNALTTGKTCRLQYRMRGGKGLYTWFSVLGRMTRGLSDEAFLNIYYSEITEREKKDLTVRETVPFILSAIMKSSNDYAFAKDKNLRYLCCSPAFLRLAGRTSEPEIVGKTDFDLFPEDMAQQFRQNDEALFAGGESLVDYDETIRDEAGTPHYCRASKHILRDSTGDIIGLYGVSRDITAEHAAQERLKLLNDSLPGGIVTCAVSPEGIQITYFNDGFCKMIGCTREEYETLAKDSIIKGVYPEDKPRLTAQVAALCERGTPIDCVYRSRRVHGDGYVFINLRGVLVGRKGDTALVNAVLYDVTAQKEAEMRMRIRETEYRFAVESGDRYIYRYNHADHSVDLTEKVAPLFGLINHLADVPESLIRNGMVAPESVGQYRAFFDAIERGDNSGTMIIRRKTAQGDWHWFSGRFNNVFDGEGRPITAIVVFSDVTEQLEKEAVYANWQQSLEQKSPENYLLLRWNLSRDTVYDAAQGSLLDYEVKPGEKLDACTRDFARGRVVPEDQARYIAFASADALLARYYRGARFETLDFRNVLPDGRTRWLRLTAEMMEYPNSADVCAFLMFEDVDQAKRSELLSREQAQTDPLTGLLNRAAFSRELDAMTRDGTPCALLMLDIDGFKQLNDTFGHAAGDQALIDIAAALRSILRGDDLVGRLGGDEFLVGLRGATDDGHVEHKARQIGSILRRDFSLDVRTSASIGIASCPRDGVEFDALYRKADAALYAVKASGKDRFAFYQPGMSVGENLTRPQSAPAVIVTNKPAAFKRRMLIVDDSKLDIELLTEMFKDEFSVIRASDGDDALVRMRYYGTAISVVLLDLHMPGTDGFAVLKRMRESEPLRLVPVIVVSGSDDRETTLRAIRLGANDFITKPVDPEIIRVRVQSAVSKAENERLRARNSLLSMESGEVAKYRAALCDAGIAVVEHDWKNGTFAYDPAIGRLIAGQYDGRGLWRVLLSDFVADVMDVRAMQRCVHDVADDRTRATGAMTVRLKTPSGEKRDFTMRVIKQVGEFNLTGKLILTFAEADGRAAQGGGGGA